MFELKTCVGGRVARFVINKAVLLWFAHILKGVVDWNSECGFLVLMGAGPMGFLISSWKPSEVLGNCDLIFLCSRQVRAHALKRVFERIIEWNVVW